MEPSNSKKNVTILLNQPEIALAHKKRLLL